MSRKKLFSWALYDFANTVFSVTVLTLHFPIYLSSLVSKNFQLGLMQTTAMLLSGLVVPVLGALSDQTGRTKRYLIQTTLVTLVALFSLSLTQNVSVLITLFCIGVFFFQAALVFYNSLLDVSAPPEHQGFASGLGVALGYLGVILTLPVAYFFQSQFGIRVVFMLASVIFLLASLPLFFNVPERAVFNPVKFQFSDFWNEWKKVFEVLKEIWHKPAALMFFGGNFFLVDAMNAMIFWFMIYTREVFGATEYEMTRLLILVNIGAFFSGLISGFLTDKYGALKVMICSAFIFLLTIAGVYFSKTMFAFSLATIFGGAFAIASIWTSGRKVLLEFAPKEKVGSYFGIYGLTIKVSVVGSLIFSLIADSHGFQNAFLILACPAGLGTLFLILSAVFKKQS